MQGCEYLAQMLHAVRPCVCIDKKLDCVPPHALNICYFYGYITQSGHKQPLVL